MPAGFKADRGAKGRRLFIAAVGFILFMVANRSASRGARHSMAAANFMPGGGPYRRTLAGARIGLAVTRLIRCERRSRQRQG